MIENGYFTMNSTSVTAIHSNELEFATSLPTALVEKVKAIDVESVRDQINTALANNDTEALKEINDTLPSHQLIRKMYDLGYFKPDELSPPARNGIEHLGFDNRIFFAIAETIWENPESDSSLFSAMASRGVRETSNHIEKLRAGQIMEMLPIRETAEYAYMRDGRIYDKKTGELVNAKDIKPREQKSIEELIEEASKRKMKTAPLKVDYSNTNWLKDTLLIDLLERKMTIEMLEQTYKTESKEQIATRWDKWQDAYKLADIYQQKLHTYGIVDSNGMLTKSGKQEEFVAPERFLDIRV